MSRCASHGLLPLVFIAVLFLPLHAFAFHLSASYKKAAARKVLRRMSASVDSVPPCADRDDTNEEEEEDPRGTSAVVGMWDQLDWSGCLSYWESLISPEVKHLPEWVRGDAEYGLTDLQKLEQAGVISGEFSSRDLRYTSKKTYAVRCGYRGASYHGYQLQKTPQGYEACLTVEGDIKRALGGGLATYAAGRTDKGVNAVGQVFCFTTSNIELDEQTILERMRSSEPVQSCRLAIFDCKRVPKAFNSRSSATWRRYLYLVPLEGSTAFLDVDFINACLGELVGRELPYHGFSYKENRDVGNGLLDLCFMYRARAFVVPDSHEGGDGRCKMLCIELVANRFLRRMVRLLVSTTLREAIKGVDQDRDTKVLKNICLSKDRLLAAPAVPGQGLCFAGVGYDAQALSFYKFQPKAKREALEKLFASQDQEA